MRKVTVAMLLSDEQWKALEDAAQAEDLSPEGLLDYRVTRVLSEDVLPYCDVPELTTRVEEV